MLSYFERKSRLPFGGQSTVSHEHGVARSTVTAVMKGVHRNRQLEQALARLMRPKTSVTEAFGEPGPERLRRTVPSPAAPQEV